MNINKIIKEEINDFEWTKHVDAYEPMPSETEEPQRTVYNSAYDEENHRIMDYIFDDGYVYDGWRVQLDKFSGVIGWDKEGKEYMICATPHFNEENITPVAIINVNDDDDDYINMFDLKVPKFEYVEEAEKWYKEDYPKLVIQSIKRNGYSWLVR